MEAVRRACGHDLSAAPRLATGVTLLVAALAWGCQSQPEASSSSAPGAGSAADTSLRLYTHPKGDGPEGAGGAIAGSGGATTAGDGSGCNPPCEAGETCYQTSCVRTSTIKETARGPIAGHIVQLIPEGSRTRLVLDVGAKAGVKADATGTIKGVKGKLTVDEVYPFRSTAVIDVDDKAIGDHRDVTITR